MDFDEVITAIIIAFAIFVAEDLYKILIIEPNRSFQSLKGEITYSLIYYANVYNNAIDLADGDEVRIEKYRNISSAFRDLACKLFVCAENRKKYNFFIPKKKDIQAAASELIGLSNGMFCPYNTGKCSETNKSNKESVQRIKSLLKISI